MLTYIIVNGMLRQFKKRKLFDVFICDDGIFSSEQNTINLWH